MRDHLHIVLLAAGSRLATRAMRAARERVRRAHLQSRVCAWCGSKIAMPPGTATRGTVRQTLRLSHGICPSCFGAIIAAHPRPPLSAEFPSERSASTEETTV